MARHLVDVVQADAGHAVVLADGGDGGVDLFAKAVVEDEIDAGVDVALRHVLQHACHGGTKLEEVGMGKVVVAIVAHGSARPAVVGSGEDEDDVGTAEVGHAGEEGTQRIVGAVVAAIAHGGAGVGVVHAEVPALLGDELVPPGLRDVGDVGALGLVAVLVVPGLVAGGRDVALEGGIRVAENGDRLGTK